MTELFRPRHLGDASEYLATHPTAILVAGGTDVMLDRRTGRVRTKELVDLTALRSELTGVRIDDESVTIGALTTARQIELHDGLAVVAPALCEAARVLGSPQIRNMATVGGNICHATPSAEFPPPLMVHDAVVDVFGRSGTRNLALSDLFVAPGQTVLDRGDIVTAVRFAVSPPASGSTYVRQTVRWAMDLAGVGVAVAVTLDEGRVARCRIVLGAVSPVPMRVIEAEETIVGRELDDALARTAGRIAAAACSPITDARGSADYRRRAVAALVPRALHLAALRAEGALTMRFAPINGIVAERTA